MSAAEVESDNAYKTFEVKVALMPVWPGGGWVSII